MALLNANLIDFALFAIGIYLLEPYLHLHFINCQIMDLTNPNSDYLFTQAHFTLSISSIASFSYLSTFTQETSFQD